ncbi:MAG TPA: proton-conducting transporter membrane subunit [Candidatus Eisenbacteria bacterium]|nr:proton-conducting transporter membrane subunit [Candidatus Eisenbacteria bacterium]
MIVLVIALVAVGAGLIVLLVRRSSPMAAQLIGLGATALVAVLAIGIDPADTTEVAGMAVAPSAMLRLVATVWSGSLLLLAILELAIGGRAVIAGPALVGLGAVVLGLGVPDPGTAFAAFAAGSVPAVLFPGVSAWVGRESEPERLTTLRRAAGAVIAATVVAIVVVAWGSSPVGPLGSGEPLTTEDPDRAIALGLALLAVAAAVIVRAGLIPAHLWAARFMEGVSSLAVPAALSWPTAAFALVALGWGQVAIGSPTATAWLEHGLIALAAVASIAFGGLAAILHEDIEHVLGYSIVQDAGIALLAFASLRPESTEAARNWLIASAAVKTALAGWVAATRWTFGAHRLPDLRGWARRSPALAVALVAITFAAVGLPGMAAFDARASLAFEAVPGGLGGLVLLASFSSILYYGRLLAVGFRNMGGLVANAPSPSPRWVGSRPTGWSSRSVVLVVQDVPALVDANRAPIVATITIALAAIGFVIAATGVGPA